MQIEVNKAELLEVSHEDICNTREGGTCNCDWSAAPSVPDLPDIGKLGWLPIETAPRRYNPPLSIVNHHAPDILGLWGKAFYCVCSWGGPSKPYWVGGDNKKIPFQPTHWMPLPQPPKDAE